jgi:hypothetical protein
MPTFTRRPCFVPCPVPDPIGRVFYVSVIDHNRYQILLGPYDRHADAEDALPLGRELAERFTGPKAAFYGFGTCSTLKADPVPTLFGYGSARDYEAAVDRYSCLRCRT